MKTFEIRIEMENSVFEEDAPTEVSRILTAIAKQVEPCVTLKVGDTFQVLDINGNRAGTARVGEIAWRED